MLLPRPVPPPVTRMWAPARRSSLNISPLRRAGAAARQVSAQSTPRPKCAARKSTNARSLAEGCRCGGKTAWIGSCGASQPASRRTRAAAGDVRGGDEVGQVDDAQPGPRRGTQRVAVVGLQIAADPHRDLLAAPGEAPAFGLRPVAVAQAIVVGEIAGLAGRAGAGEVGRRRGADEAGSGQPARDQAAVGQAADPHGEVEPFRQQVDDAVVQVELEADRRVRGQERRARAGPGGESRRSPAR